MFPFGENLIQYLVPKRTYSFTDGMFMLRNGYRKLTDEEVEKGIANMLIVVEISELFAIFALLMPI